MAGLLERFKGYIKLLPTGNGVWVDDLTDICRMLQKQEQGLLIELPCKAGDAIYVIPSLTNYRLNELNPHFQQNNRVYKQVVERIEFFQNGYVLVTCGGMRSVLGESFEKTWFLKECEAEEALAKMGGK